jgi:hypothetical protein
MVTAKSIITIAVCLFATIACVNASGFLITVRNVANTPVQFMLFQKHIEPDINSYSVAWRVGMLGPLGQEGPYPLPEEVEVMVLDVDESDPRAEVERHTGPYSAEFNDKWNFLLSSGDSVPLLTKTNGVAPAGQIMIANDPHTYKPVTVAIAKNGIPLIRQANVRPGSSEVLSIEPVIYITYIQTGSMRQGEDFRAVNIGTPVRGFKLNPGSTNVRIEIFAQPNGAIDYRLA